MNSMTCVAFHSRMQLSTGPVWCRWCGDYVSLGPSKDRRRAVRDEIWAADYAQAVSDGICRASTLLAYPGAASTLAMDIIEHHEADALSHSASTAGGGE